ncbi:MAG: hypothetical protein N2504_03975 [candidate division WOR-3 bacterium]|nr:hypothetical protein [candidate division WOR-3 bacterium]
MLTIFVFQFFYEDFESPNFPPSNWQNVGTRNTKWVRRTSGVVFGSASAGIQIAQTSSEVGTAILQTPLINLPSVNPYDTIVFSFYYRLPSVGGQFDTRFRSTDTIKVQISTDGNNWNNLIVWDSTTLFTNANNQNKKVQFDISSYQNLSIYIRWIFIDNTNATVSSNSYFNIDSIFVGIKQGNPPPSYIPIDSIQKAVYPNTDSSIFSGQTITTTGIIAEVGKYNGRGFHIKMKNGGPYSGIYVYTTNIAGYSKGDSVIVSGVVKEYYKYTEITNPNIQVISQNVSFKVDTLITDSISSSSPTTAERYEGVYIFIRKAVIVDASHNYRYTIKNGNLSAYLSKYNVQNLQENDIVSVWGVLVYEFGEYRIYADSVYIHDFPYRLEKINYGYGDGITFKFRKKFNPNSDVKLLFSVSNLNFDTTIFNVDSFQFMIRLNSLERGFYNAVLGIVYNNDTNLIKFRLPYPNGFSCVLINEFDDFPTVEEFIEIKNFCPYKVNIGNLFVKSYSGVNIYTSSVFPNIELEPNGIFVFVYDTFQNNICQRYNLSNCIALPKWTYLNSQQPMVISTEMGFAVDSLWYDSYWGGRHPYTTIRVSKDERGWTRSAWGPSATINGTPGKENDIYITDSDEIVVNKKDLAKGEILHFAFNIKDESDNIYIYLYDDVGRYIDRIYYERNYTTKKGLVFYNTSKLKPGIYLVAITVNGKTRNKVVFRIRPR